MTEKPTGLGLKLAALYSTTMQGFLKTRGLWVLLLMVVLFGLASSSMHLALHTVGDPHAGFLPFSNLRVGAFIRQDWAGARADLKYQDRVLAVEGEPVQDASSFRSFLEPGHTLNLTLDRDSENQATVLVEKLTPKDVFAIFTPLFGTGLAFLAIALLLLLIFPSPPGIMHLVSFCVAAGIFFLFAYDFHTTYRWIPLYLIAFAWIAPSVLNLAWTLPERKRVSKTWVIASYLGTLLLIVPYVTLHRSRPDLWGIVELMVIGCVSLSYIAWLYSVFRSYRFAKDPQIRDQSKILLLPIALAFGLTFLVSWAIIALGLQFPLYWMAPLSLVFPLTISYTILRKNLFWLRHLEAEVQTRTEELEKSRQELYEASRMASVGTLSAGMAHEIGNAMHLIQSNLPILRTYVEDLLKGEEEDRSFIQEDTPELLQHMDAGAKRTMDIVNDLKAFAKPSEKGTSAVDLRDIVLSVLRLLHPKIPSDVVLKKDLSEIPPLLLHAGQVHQILINLLLNAIDAVGQEGEIHVRLEAEEKTARLSVTDSGHGMTEEEIRHCMDPFFTHKEGGSGLGLSVVQGLVQANGGKILIKSEREKGSTFTVVFPLE